MTNTIENLRADLIVLEETLIFAFIERCNFKQNSLIYDRNSSISPADGQSFFDFVFESTEKTHALIRRYESPDEHPFYPKNLPLPILPQKTYPSHLSTKDPNKHINHNPEIREFYISNIIPKICSDGVDEHFGSSALNDIHLLQAMSKRIHYGKFIAEAKFRERPNEFLNYIKTKDTEKLLSMITDLLVETKLLERVRLKCETYGQFLSSSTRSPFPLKVDDILSVYSSFILPMTKKVQVEYLLFAYG